MREESGGRALAEVAERGADADMAGTPGVTWGGWDLKVSGVVPRLRFQEGENYLGLLSRKVRRVQRHHVEELGWFHCFNGICCDYHEPQVRFVLPAVRLSVNGLRILPTEMELGLLILPEKVRDRLGEVSRALSEAGESITSVDLRFVCRSKEAQFIDAIAVAGISAWRKAVEAKAMFKQWKEVSQRAYSVAGRSLDEGRYRRIMGIQGSSAPKTPKAAFWGDDMGDLGSWTAV